MDFYISKEKQDRGNKTQHKRQEKWVNNETGRQ